MPPRPLDVLPDEIARALLEKIAPGSRLLHIELMPGSFSNHTHLLEAVLPSGRHLKCAVRRYQVFGDYDRGEKARREYKAFELMNRRGIPSPEPLFLDDTGELLGVPGIVTRFVEGQLLLDAPPEPLEWAGKLARMLARIHAIPLDDESRGFLLDADRQAAWFLSGGQVPGYMQVFPQGAAVWQAVHHFFPVRKPVPSALVHVDYWAGNILWQDNEISAVFDWEEAACGDPVIDVAYARMNMFLLGLPEAADEFLRIYQEERGSRVENLALWELAAAARPMIAPVDWEMDRPGIRERFSAFISRALKVSLD
jgi:aminoglycoside phosphotransferase (APT) family kinase protein